MEYMVDHTLAEWHSRPYRSLPILNRSTFYNFYYHCIIFHSYFFRKASEFVLMISVVSRYVIPSTLAEQFMILTKKELENDVSPLKHLEYFTGPSVSTRNLSLLVFFNSTFFSSE